MKKKDRKGTLSQAERSLNRLLKFIIGGILASCVTIIVSLCVVYNPQLFQDITKIAGEAYTSITNRLTASHDSRESADPASEASQSTDAITYMERSQEKGDISDFDSQFVLTPEDATYMVMLDTAAGPMFYYNQGDSRWRNYLYGGADPMSKYGCGPTAAAMVVNSFTSSGITPVEMADWAAQNGYYAPQSGSYHSLIPESLKAFGLEVESVKDRSYENAANHLRAGKLLVALMGKGALTENGHFIIITELLDNGNVRIADPNSYENSTKEWDLGQLLSELKKSYDSGGPLWAVGI